MRAFIAVELSKEIKDYLHGLQEDFKNRLKKEKNNVKLSWVAKKNLHLTLKFLGNVDEKKIEEVKKRLTKIEIESFEVYLDKIGFFPNDDDVKVIYIGLQPESKIIKLQQRIDMELLELFNKEQGFHGHVTIARVKMIKDGRIVNELLNEKVERKKMILEGFQLMKSDLKKDGPSYTRLWEKKS
ncbi:MAG TPA: RNA 2',3'-cyclic phosphodiesterase [Candidatus Nanoarchaeia archaeon]|nr:RNA 2',3'-cyclic phosphodiesterase [Candidatus Nanoarchaeia archaeon]